MPPCVRQRLDQVQGGGYGQVGFYPADEVPTIDPEFLAQERRSMSPDAYASEYEGVFGTAGASLFTLDQLAGLILPKDGAA